MKGLATAKRVALGYTDQFRVWKQIARSAAYNNRGESRSSRRTQVGVVMLVLSLVHGAVVPWCG